MTPHKDASYWDRGWRNVPDMTGTRRLQDAPDLKHVLASFGLQVPLWAVLDVGCGSGRAAQLCNGYRGVDIAQSMIDWCDRKGVNASLIGGHEDLPYGPYGTVLCVSVFTHMGRDERRVYLAAFARCGARSVVADVFHGDGSGTVAIWTAVAGEVAQDFRDNGWSVCATADYRWEDSDRLPHTYYHAEIA